MYLSINHQWFDKIKLTIDVNKTYRVWAHGEEYMLDIWVKDGKPNGFYGLGWNNIYAKLHLNNHAVVFQHYYHDVFKMSVSDQYGSEVVKQGHKEVEIFTNNNICFTTSDLVMFEPRQWSRKVDLYSTYPEDVIFERKFTSTVLEKRSLTIPKSFVRRFGLMNFTFATLRYNRFEYLMRLKSYRGKKQQSIDLKDHVVLRGDWKALQKSTKLRERRILRFVLNIAFFDRAHQVLFDIV